MLVDEVEPRVGFVYLSGHVVSEYICVQRVRQPRFQSAFRAQVKSVHIAKAHSK